MLLGKKTFGVDVVKRKTRLLGLLAVLVVWLLASCGYRPASQGSFSLPKDIHTLAITEVDNPTLDAELGQRVRSLFRDEVRRRGLYTFAEPERADARVRIIIPQQSTFTRVEDDDDQTLRLETSVQLRALVHRRLDDEQVLDTGIVGAFETFFGESEDSARTDALDLAIRRLVDRFANDF